MHNKNYRFMRKVCGVDDRENEKSKRSLLEERKKKQVMKLEGLYMYIMKW